jgi:hypothetical protein
MEASINNLNVIRTLGEIIRHIRIDRMETPNKRTSPFLGVMRISTVSDPASSLEFQYCFYTPC